MSVGASGVNVYAVLINGTTFGISFCKPTGTLEFLISCLARVRGKIAAVPGVESTYETIPQRLKTRTYLSLLKPR